MNRIFRPLAAAVTVLALLGSLSTPVAAIESKISIDPILPDQQADGTKSYFDLQLQPGEEMELTVQVDNISDSDVQIAVEAITASTSGEGLINLISQPQWVDSTLEYAFAELARVPEENMTVPAGESAFATVVVQMPEQEFDGVVLGAIHIVHDPVQDGDSQFHHEFSHAVPVQLSTGELRPAYAFDLGDASALAEDHQVAISAHIRNTAPVIAKDIRIGTAICDDNGNAYWTHLVEGVEMAPNSIFPLEIVDELPPDLPPGEYHTEFTVKIGEEEWGLEAPLYGIAAVQDEDVLPQDRAAPFQLPQIARLILYVVAAVAAVGILAFLGLLLHIRAQNKRYYAYMRRMQKGGNPGKEEALK